jgi:hypothetical protein
MPARCRTQHWAGETFRDPLGQGIGVSVRLEACRSAASAPDRFGFADLDCGRRHSARAVRIGAGGLRAVRRGLPARASGRAGATARRRPRPHAHACGRGIRHAAGGPAVARTACRSRAYGSQLPGPCPPRAGPAGTPPCPLPPPPCVPQRRPALGSARIPRPPGSLPTRHQSFTPPAFQGGVLRRRHPLQ